MFSFLINLLLGFVSYILVSWPREILRAIFTKFTLKNFCLSLGVLNPIRYVDPVGFLSFVSFDFGWTRAPFVDYPKSGRRDLITYSLYGILSSFLLFLLYGVLARMLLNSKYFEVFITRQSGASPTLLFLFSRYPRLMVVARCLGCSRANTTSGI